MKHNQIFPILLFFTLSYPAQSQFFERTFQTDFYNFTADLREGANGQLYCVTGSGGQSSFQTVYMHNIDSQGNTNTFPLFYYGLPLDYDWIPVPGGFIATGDFFECDINLPRHNLYFDLAGNLLWEKEEDPVDPNTYIEIKLLPGPGNTYWMFRGGAPIQFDLNGDSIGVAPSSLPLFKGYTTTGTGNLLTYGQGLALYNPSLTNIQLGLSNTEILKADVLPDSRYVVLTETSLLILDSNFNIEKEIYHGITWDPEQPMDMTANSDNIWLLAQTVPKQLLHYDTALTLLENKTIPAGAAFQPKLLASDDQRLALTGEEYGMPYTQVVSVRSMPEDEISFDATADAAVIDVISTKPPTGYFWSSPFSHSIVFDSVYVVVKNEGSATLQEVTVNASLGSITYICQEYFYYQGTFSDLNLQPGESIQLEIGKITQRAPFVLPTVTTLCFWTTLPNDSLDYNGMNNGTCRDFQVIVSDNEPQYVAPLNISPNPATDHFLIQWPGDPNVDAIVQMFDITGRLISERRVTGSECSLQRENIPAGIYQVILTDDNGRVYSGKIVLE